MMRSMVRSMMRPVSQWSRPGRSVASVSRLRVDRGPLVSHVGNEAALEQLALFYGILTIFVPHLPSCVLYCNIYT